MYKTKRFKIILWLISILYAGIVIKLVLFKKPLEKYHEVNVYSIERNFRNANFTPFHTIVIYLSGKPGFEHSFENIIGNIILFIPLTILIPLLIEKIQEANQIILIGFLTSLAFEVIQLFGLRGNFDVDDLILDTLGGIIGYFIFIQIKK